MGSSSETFTCNSLTSWEVALHSCSWLCLLSFPTKRATLTRLDFPRLSVRETSSAQENTLNLNAKNFYYRFTETI
jgi:hypothetical protein